MTKEEIWKPHQRYPKYEVSNLGNFRHIENKKNRKFFIKNEYYYCQIIHRGKQKNVYIHIAVCETFNERPRPFRDYYVVKHKDDIKLNCEADNLEWGTQASNIQDYHRNRRAKYAGLPY